MKRKMLARAAVFCAAVLLSGALAGCGKTGSGESTGGTENGSSKESSQETSVDRINLKDIDVNKYVTVGDYKSIRVEKREVTVSDSELEEFTNQIYIGSFPEELGVKDRAVKEGDTANIDYVGKKDGVAFDGGTAQGANLTIGSDTYIDGFEDGLIGVMPGDTVDLNLTFPERYDNQDLAGQAVVFTVTVNYIIPEEKTDEAVKKFGVEGVTTVEEFRQYLYDYLYDVNEMKRDSQYEQEVLNAFLAVCEFQEIPQEYLDSYRETARQNITDAAVQSGVDPETYVNYYYGMDLNSFLAAYSDNALRQNIAMQVVADKEGLAVDDEELNTTLQQYASEAGYDSVEEYVGEGSLEEIRDYLMYENVYNYLMEIAGQPD